MLTDGKQKEAKWHLCACMAVAAGGCFSVALLRWLGHLTSYYANASWYACAIEPVGLRFAPQAQHYSAGCGKQG